MLAAGPFGLGPLEIGIIVLVIVLIFGVGKVADLGGALGKSVREFRREASAKDDAPSTNESPTTQTGASFCSNCGNQLDANAQACAKCGAPVRATVN
jgi:sec-independent protein translocase protein TatA